MEDYLPVWLSVEDALALFSGFSAFVVIFLIWKALLDKDIVPARIRALKGRRASMKDEITIKGPRRRSRQTQLTFMRRVVTQLKLLRGKQAQVMAAKLASAGMRSKDALVTFMFVKLIAPFVGGILGYLFFFIVEPFDLALPIRMLAVFGCVGFGYFAPDIFVKNAANKRKDLIRKALPDALDLMVICAEAGLNLNASLDRVSREIAGSSVELADELGLASIELSFLPDRRQAMENLVARCDLPGIKALVGTLMQTEKYGTPLARALRVLSGELREERLMKAEEKAARLPAILTVPMMIFIMPTLFIVLLGPAVLRTIDSLSKLM